MDEEESIFKNKIFITSIILLIITGVVASVIAVIQTTSYDDDEFLDWYEDAVLKDNYYGRVSEYVDESSYSYAIKFSNRGTEYCQTLLSEIDNFKLTKNYNELRNEYKEYLKDSYDAFVYTSLCLGYLVADDDTMFEAYRDMALESLRNASEHFDNCVYLLRFIE